MTCGDKFNRNCPTGGTRVTPEEVGGRPTCIHPGCGKPLQGDGTCVYGHSQNPAELARQMVAEVRENPRESAKHMLSWLSAAVDTLAVAERADDPALLAEIEAAMPPKLRPLLEQAREHGDLRLADIVGREHVKRALEVAAASGQEVCLEGAPADTAPFAAWAKAQGIRVLEAAPCACGNYGHPEHECTCSPAEVARWRKKKLQRQARAAPLRVEVPPLDRLERREPPRRGEPGGHVLARAVLARQARPVSLRLDEAGHALLRAAERQLNLGWAKAQRIVETSASIAQLAEYNYIHIAALAEAIQYRPRASFNEWGVTADPGPPLVFRAATGQPRPPRFEDIPGQEHVKHALEAALVGGHTVAIIAVDGGEDDLQPFIAWGRANGVAVTVTPACPCGSRPSLKDGAERGYCTCRPPELEKYHAALRERLSAADIVVTAGRVPYDKYADEFRSGSPRREAEEQVLARVATSRGKVIPTPRFASPAVAEYAARLYDRWPMQPTERERVERVAMTLAHHDGEKGIGERQMATAIQWTSAANLSWPPEKAQGEHR